ncbi:NERD domain-containing protein [Butyrivibrio sp. AE3009]|uniref:NERD domain-containing protein n=1 Tax=Butyrivibrio sp. AE3009 TaxID=1280666 RepID=UPI0003B36D86|nr:NERD domain-containing protein [Butyrivibrio sp. AE3009]
MFCIHCGTDVGDTAKFCRKCGKPVSRPGAAGNTSNGASVPGSAAGASAAINQQKYQQLRMMAQSSAQRLAVCPGYYCFKCGCYVERARAAHYGDIKCHQCGAPIINPNMLSHAGTTLLKYGFIGSLVVAASEAADYTNPENYILNYYKSIYYEQNKYPFETVATDKGKMGEYLVDVGYQQFKRIYPQFKTYIFYNLLVPEPNGSFQEIDAVIVFGAFVFVIEAKNRGGYFAKCNLSDKYWSFRPFGGQTQNIYNPFLQNNEHIAALQHYLDQQEGMDFSPVFANYVTLAGNANLDWNQEGDTIDQLLIGDWRITNVGGLGAALTMEFAGFAEDMRTQSDDEPNCYDDKYAQQTIKALMPLINMSEDVKKAKMRDRMDSDGDFGKRAYQYFYIEVEECMPYLFRTNWIHEQIIGPGSIRWKPGYDQVEIVDNRTLRWREHKTQKVRWYKIESYTELLEAYECVKQCETYDYHGKYDDNSGSNNRGSQGGSSRRGSGNSGSGGASTGDPIKEAVNMFFSGCDDITSLNSRYRSLCKVFHPDGGNGDEETFKKMQAAYESLKEKMSA